MTFWERVKSSWTICIAFGFLVFGFALDAVTYLSPFLGAPEVQAYMRAKFGEYGVTFVELIPVILALARLRRLP